MGNFLPEAIIEMMIERLQAGESLRKIAADLGVSKGTVERYRKIMLHELSSR